MLYLRVRVVLDPLGAMRSIVRVSSGFNRSCFKELVREEL